MKKVKGKFLCLKCYSVLFRIIQEIFAILFTINFNQYFIILVIQVDFSFINCKFSA